MLEQNRRTATWSLPCAVALLSVGCATTQDERSPGRATACPNTFLHYCTETGHGRRCGCMPTQAMEKILRARQGAGP
jgi:hypothetical protein